MSPSLLPGNVHHLPSVYFRNFHENKKNGEDGDSEIRTLDVLLLGVDDTLLLGV